MHRYLILTPDTTVTVLADSVLIRDGALCFFAEQGGDERFVIAYAPGCWKFFGLLDATGTDIPNIVSNIED